MCLLLSTWWMNMYLMKLSVEFQWYFPALPYTPNCFLKHFSLTLEMHFNITIPTELRPCKQLAARISCSWSSGPLRHTNTHCINNTLIITEWAFMQPWNDICLVVCRWNSQRVLDSLVARPSHIFQHKWEKSGKPGRSGGVIGCGLRCSYASQPTLPRSGSCGDAWPCSLRARVGRDT